MDAKVAEIFLAMCPDFPIPETITLPFEAKMSFTAFEKDSSMLFSNRSNARASLSTTRFPVFINSLVFFWFSMAFSEQKYLCLASQIYLIELYWEGI